MNFFYNIIRIFVKTLIPENSYLKIRQKYKFLFGKKEIQLTQKYALELSSKEKKETINIVFIIWMESMWNSLWPIYEKALENPQFNVYILAQPHITDREHKKNQNPAYDFLSSLYSDTINAYKNDNWFDLKSLNPDYVFYTYPYSSYYYKDYAPAEVRKIAKVCFIQYGFDLTDNAIFERSYNWLFMKNVSMLFATCRSAEKKLKRYYGRNIKTYPKILFKGFSRFDLIKKTETKNEKKCILWAPRWTAPSQRKYDTASSFFKYYQKFLSFASSHPELDFIIRPHPLMFPNFLAQKLITQSEIDDYKHQCNLLGNIQFDEGADYLSTINKTDIFITDFSSLILEYFITSRPIIFLAKGKGFAPEAQYMDKTLYHAFSWNEIEDLLNNLIAGNDEMKAKRLSVMNEFLPKQYESISSAILDSIKNDYYGD